MTPAMRHAVEVMTNLGIELRDGDYPGARKRLTAPQAVVVMSRAMMLIIERGAMTVIGRVLG